MLLVIFGAGASYDSAPSQPPPDVNSYRPPLASELFGNRKHFGEVMNKYGECLPIIQRLRHVSAGGSVESELQRLMDEATHLIDRHKQLAAIRFYLQEILWVCSREWMKYTQNISNYSSLIDHIRCWKQPHQKVCFVTFNYDTLLEHALSQNGYPFDELSAYVAKDLMLVKIHGSVNWGRKVKTPIHPDIVQGKNERLIHFLIENSHTLEVSKDYRLTGVPPSARANDAFFPALAIPVEGKLAFECPDDHIKALESFLPHVTRILVIGWRATEKPFLDLLTAHVNPGCRTMMIVNGGLASSQNAANNMMLAHLPVPHYRPLEYGFTKFLRQPESVEFLKT